MEVHIRYRLQQGDGEMIGRSVRGGGKEGEKELEIEKAKWNKVLKRREEFKISSTNK